MQFSQMLSQDILSSNKYRDDLLSASREIQKHNCLQNCFENRAYCNIVSHYMNIYSGQLIPIDLYQTLFYLISNSSEQHLT